MKVAFAIGDRIELIHIKSAIGRKVSDKKYGSQVNNQTMRQNLARKKQRFHRPSVNGQCQIGRASCRERV